MCIRDRHKANEERMISPKYPPAIPTLFSQQPVSNPKPSMQETGPIENDFTQCYLLGLPLDADGEVIKDELAQRKITYPKQFFFIKQGTPH